MGLSEMVLDISSYFQEGQNCNNRDGRDDQKGGVQTRNNSSGIDTHTKSPFVWTGRTENDRLGRRRHRPIEPRVMMRWKGGG